MRPLDPTITTAVLAAAILAILSLASCSGGEKELGQQVTVKLPSVGAASPSSMQSPQPAKLSASDARPQAQLAAATSAQAEGQGSSRYSSLEPTSCELVGGTEQERAFARRRCAGAAGYALERSESDPLHDLAIVSPGGARSELDLAKLVHGGDLGQTAEWRGQAPGQPRALIMRVSAEDKDPLGPATSDLVVVKLGGAPCVVAIVPQGPAQNAKARAVADRKLLSCAKS